MMTTKTTKKTAAAVLAEAVELAAVRAAALEEARAAEAGMLERLAAGDDSVSAEALAVAAAEVTRAEALAGAAERARVAAVAASEYTGEVGVGEALARGLERVTGLPVSVERRVPDGVPEVLPALVVVQSAPSSSDPLDGVVSGSVSLLYFAGPFHVAFDAERVARELEEVQVSARLFGGGVPESRDGCLVARFSVQVERAFAELPRVAASNLLGGWAVSWSGSALVAPSLHRRVQVSGERGAGAGYEVQGSTRVESSSCVEGVTRTVVRSRVGVKVSSTHPYLEPSDLPGLVADAAAGAVGVATRLGRVVSGRAVGGAEFSSGPSGRVIHCERDIELTFEAVAV